MSQWVVDLVAATITLVWAVQFIGAVILDAFTPSTEVTILFAGLAGVTLGIRFFRNNGTHQ